MKVLINGKDSGERVKDTAELLALALHYFLHGEDKTIITLEDEPCHQAEK